MRNQLSKPQPVKIKDGEKLKIKNPCGIKIATPNGKQ